MHARQVDEGVAQQRVEGRLMMQAGSCPQAVACTRLMQPRLCHAMPSHTKATPCKQPCCAHAGNACPHICAPHHTTHKWRAEQADGQKTLT